MGLFKIVVCNFELLKAMLFGYDLFCWTEYNKYKDQINEVIFKLTSLLLILS